MEKITFLPADLYPVASSFHKYLQNSLLVTRGYTIAVDCIQFSFTSGDISLKGENSHLKFIFKPQLNLMNLPLSSYFQTKY